MYAVIRGDSGYGNQRVTLQKLMTPVGRVVRGTHGVRQPWC